MRFFITGVSRGLGQALARECLSRGHEVWGVSRSGPSGGNSGLRHFRCDISKFQEVRRTADEMIAAGYVPDVFILNAAAIREDFDGGLDLEAVRETFETGLFGNLYWLKVFSPILSHRSEGAVFLNISSVAAFRAILRRKVAYAASKTAMDMMFEGLRIQYGEGRIRFITVNLGPLDDKRRFPLFTAGYPDAAARIIDLLESGRIRDSFTYPYFAGLLYRAARLLPDGVIRRLVR